MQLNANVKIVYTIHFTYEIYLPPSISYNKSRMIITMNSFTCYHL